MYTLTYKSRANGIPKPGQMQELLEKSRRWNMDNGISGCLVYYRGGFVQLLEGETDLVKELWDKIRTDARHSEVFLISEEEIVEREFPNWNMAYHADMCKEGNLSDAQQFKSNLTLLADLKSPGNLTARLFWKHVGFLIKHPPLP